MQMVTRTAARLAAGVLVVILWTTVLSVGASRPAGAEDTKRYILIGANNTLPTDLESLVAASGGRVVDRVDEVGIATVESSEPDFRFAAGVIPGVQGITEDRPVLFAPPPADSSIAWESAGTEGIAIEGSDPALAKFAWAQWNMRAIGADKAWAAGFQGDARVTVAVLDTGIDYTHQDLVGKVDFARSVSFFSEPVPPGVLSIADLNGHGTHVAAIIAAAGRGVAGVAPRATLIAVKVAGKSGFADWATIIKAIVFAANAGADVINMSFGETMDEDGPVFDRLEGALERAVEYAFRKGAFLVASAGNDGVNWDRVDDLVKVPAQIRPVAGASATGPNHEVNPDALTPYSNYGKRLISFAAPGGNGFAGNPALFIPPDGVLSACSSFIVVATVRGPIAPCGSRRAYIVMYGTSMAAAHVSGVAALADSVAGGSLRGRQIFRLLVQFSDDLGPRGRDALYGYGRVNALRTATGAAAARRGDVPSLSHEEGDD